MLLQSKRFEVFADYHQFYLWDRDMNPMAPEDYTDDDVARRIKAAPHVVVIQPERDTEVAVKVEIHDVEPAYDPAEWDHIAEASLHLPTGHLQVHECTGGPVSEFEVEPGWYRVRSFHGGFDTIDEDGLEGEDYYKVVMWTSPADGVVVVKQFAPSGAA